MRSSTTPRAAVVSDVVDSTQDAASPSLRSVSTSSPTSIHSSSQLVEREEEVPSSFDDSKNEFFDTSSFLNFNRELAVIVRGWNVILGISAMLDFLAATVHSRYRGYCPVDLSGIDGWLRENAFELGMIFSFLWFFDAFVTAAQVHRRSLQDAEKARLLREEGWEERTKNAEWKASMQFITSILIQLLLLPVGFYIWLSSGKEIKVTVEHNVGVSDFNQTEKYTQNANQSLLYAIFHYATLETSEVLRQKALHHGKRSIFRWLRRNLRHPVKFARFVTKITRWMLWVKIIGPVVGTTNKLLGNSLDLFKRIKQRRQAAQAAKIRRMLWREMSEEELREYAAVLIEKTFRASLMRKHRRALEILHGNVERLAAIKLQARFRTRLQQAKLRIKRKRQELEKLEEKAKRFHKDKMSDTERIRMYKLQAELTRDAQSFMNKSLLRPNTTFSVIWKTTYVIFVVLELSALIIQINYPKLTKESLIPLPFSELKECRSDTGGPLQKFLSIFGLKNKVSRPLPRYCQEDMIALQALGIYLWCGLIELVIFAIGFMFFFDVPVSFFTGRFNEDTGILEPNPFFERWIAPGVLLQMIVNPQMSNVAEIVAHTASRIRILGPIRVFRWTVAAFFPLFLVVARAMSFLWIKLVAHQNMYVICGESTKTSRPETEFMSSSNLDSMRLSVVARNNPNQRHRALISSSPLSSYAKS